MHKHKIESKRENIYTPGYLVLPNEVVVPRLDIAGVKSTLAKCIKYNLFVFQTNCMMFPKISVYAM